MKEYNKPFIEDETIEIDDICAMSGTGVSDPLDINNPNDFEDM